MNTVQVLRRERWEVRTVYHNRFIACLVAPPTSVPVANFYTCSMLRDQDRTKLKVGARFVEQEYYEDTPGGSRRHCWRIRFPWD